MARGGREKIKLESTAGTGHFYTTSKNKKTTPGKLEFMKYDPKVRKPDISRARALLGWEPLVDRDTGLRRTMEFYKQKLAK